MKNKTPFDRFGRPARQLRRMNFISGWDRQQVHLLPERIEDYVGPDNLVRFLDAWVDTLDLRALGFVFPKADARGRGAPAYPPGDLLRLYLYGYFHQIRSSRRLEAECGRNLELLWLVRKLAPDFKTLADFRKNNAPAFTAALRQFNRLCRQENLFGGELLAIDGTKVKAQNAADQNWTQTKLDKQAARLEARLAEYLAALEQADRDEAPRPAAAPTAAQLKEKIEQLRARQTEVQAAITQMQKEGVTELSATDPDSRTMKSKGRHVVGYNVQGVADAKHHLLVTTEVINAASDQGQLAPMAQAAKEELNIERADVVADGGYVKSQDIKDCQDLGMEPHLPAVQNSPSERAGFYGKADFRYDPARDVYHCPAGAELTRRRQMEDKGRTLFNYDHPKACANCPLKSRCTSAGHRTVSRWEHEGRLERMAAQVKAAPEKLARRKTIIEHCWGTLHWLLPGGFLVKGLKKVRAEVSLAHFAYNLKRALAVLGLGKLLAAVGKMARPAGSAREKAGDSVHAARKRTPIGSDWIRCGLAASWPARPSKPGGICFSHRLFRPLQLASLFWIRAWQGVGTIKRPEGRAPSHHFAFQ
ncbi:MAG: IS1182 family transposase [Terriglobales bacterium]